MSLRGFGPVIDSRSRVLVLGSFPSGASLAAGHYYAHPRNQFWRILAEVTGEALAQLHFPARYQRVLEHRIAIWDVLGACEREGSLDADIRRPVPNEFDRLRQLGPGIRWVLFNGRAAGQYEQRLLGAGYRTRVLGSSSPANAGWTFERKLVQWREAFDEALVPCVEH